MFKRSFLAMLLFTILLPLSLPAEESYAFTGSTIYGQKHVEFLSINNEQANNEIQMENEEKKVPAKQAHEDPQKWVNVILVFVFIFGIAGFVAVGIVMKKSEK